jgi:hypothetical protein
MPRAIAAAGVAIPPNEAQMEERVVSARNASTFWRSRTTDICPYRPLLNKRRMTGVGPQARRSLTLESFNEQ